MTKANYERPIINRVSAGVPDKFGMKTRIQPISKIDGVDVKSILAQYGSPVFILSENTIRRTYQDAYRAFSTRYPRVQFAWSYKTNYLDAVCNIFHQEGSWAEVVSGFEYHKAINNGVEPQHIIFNGPDKSEADLILAINNGSLIHIDHFDELYLILKLSDTLTRRPKVAIRVNMDTGIYPKWDRFGFNYENGEAWNALNRIMISGKLDLVGIHTHIGTYISSVQAYTTATTKMVDLILGLKRKYNFDVKYIDMGGGFPSKNTLKGAYLPGIDTTPTFEQFAEAITGVLLSSELDPQNLPLLILETGRALIDDAGYIAGSVLANKRLSDGRRAMIIDIGVNLLFASFWYDYPVVPINSVSGNVEDTTIYGPLCMNIDVIRASVQFPALNAGEHVLISRVGAYNMTQWMQFITLRPNIVLIGADKQVYLLRKAETPETITSNELVPDVYKKFNV